MTASEFRVSADQAPVYVDAYPVLDDDGPTVFYLRMQKDGGETRVAVFTSNELREFACNLIGLVAREENRV